MSDDYIELTEDQFDVHYPLKPNHLNPSAGWAVGDAEGCLFDTNGEELAFVRRQDPRSVWTLLDGDDGDMYVVNGFHFVNRIGYLASTIPVPDNLTIEAHLPMSKDIVLPEDDHCAA
jgi:hypothetical protein